MVYQPFFTSFYKNLLNSKQGDLKMKRVLKESDNEYQKPYVIRIQRFSNGVPTHLLIEKIGKYNYTVDVDLTANGEITLSRGNRNYRNYQYNRNADSIYNIINRILHYLRENNLVTAQECSHILDDLETELLKLF
jgi:hypothetical protein